MTDVFAPYRIWTQAMATGLLLWEVQTVMTLRLTGLAGWHRLPAGEAFRMVAEKPPAFAEAFAGWQKAALAGKDFGAQGAAFARPLSRKARANRTRLTRTRRTTR